MFKGTFLAQVIGVIGMMFLAKLYGSEAFGLFGVFVSLSGMFTILFTLQYEYCLVTIKNNNERKNLFNSLFLLIIITAIFVTFTLFATSLFIRLESKNYFISYLALIGAIFFSLNKTHEIYLTNKECFKPISNAKIATIFLSLFFQIILYKYFTLKGLIFGNILAIIIISIYFFKLNNGKISTIDFSLLKSTLKTNSTIIKHVLPANLINNIANNVTPILISFYFGIEFYGVYYLSIKILSTPLYLITSSVAQVYYKESDKLFKVKHSNLLNLTKNIVLCSVGIMLLFLVLLNTVGIYILEYIFNKTWENLRIYTLILSFLVLAKSVFTPISDIIIVLNKNHISLVFSIYLLIINFLSFHFGYVYNNLILSLVLIVVFSSIGYFFQLFYFLKELKKE